MAIVGQLMVLVTGNTAPLTAALATSQAQVTGFAASSTASLAGLRTALAGIGAGAVVGIGLAVNAARDFQSQMAIVNTIARLTPDALADVGNEIRALSVATGSPLEDLTSSFYDLLSVGVPVGNAMEFLTNATTLSIGGLSTSKEAVDAITTSINAWSGATGAANLSMTDSLRVADLWAKGIEVGGFTAADIGTALSNVAAQASTFNTPLEQVVATTALLTTRGFTASTALTSMDAAFTALQRVPPGMQNLQDATGKAYEQIARTEGIHEAIVQIVADAEQFGIGLVDVFGRTDALGYVINTTGNSARAYEQILTSMYDASGTAAGQAAERSATLDRQMQILGASINDLGISVGTGLLPPLTTFVQSVNGVVQGVGQWAAANPQVASTILPVIAAVAALALGVTALNVVLGLSALILSPVGIAFAAIVGIIAVVVANMAALERGIQRVVDVWNHLTSLPGFQQSPQAQAFTQQFQAEHGRRPNPVELQAAGIGFNPFAPGHNTNPLIDSVRGGAIFGGSSPDERAPLQLNNTTNVYLDGQKISESTDRQLYNKASQASSGFNRGALEY